MELAFTEGRAVRMLVALLAAADPLGRVDGGQHPTTYEPLARAVLGDLRDGGTAQQLRETLVEQAGPGSGRSVDYGAADAFVAAVLDWWPSTARMLQIPLAG